MHPHEISEKGRFLVFATDFSAYHIPFIQKGIQSYFEKGPHELSYVHMDITELIRLLGPGITERTAAIALFRTPEAIRYFENRGIPCMNLVGDSSDPTLGFDVQFENEGTVAARCFLEEMRLGNLGFVGFHPSGLHERRLGEFQREARRYGVGVELCEFEKSTRQRAFFEIDEDELENMRTRLRSFLLRLSKPAGIFCGDDRIALNLFYTAEFMGYSVPDEVAIIGISSRSHAAESWTNAVSAILLDHQKQGYLAAKLMDEYLAGGSVPTPVKIQPNGVQHRQTTVRRSVSDSMVRRALLLIQQKPETTVDEIAADLGTTRRVLDIRFQRATNMSTAKAIESERFNKAARLIRERHYSFESIAALSGYPNRRSMRRSFYRFTRMNPQQFRDIGIRRAGDGKDVENDRADPS